MPKSPHHFDRLAGLRRNRRIRNYSAIAAGAALLLTAVLWLDPKVSGSPPHDGVVIFFGLLFLAAFLSAVYFHLRYLSRE